MALKQSKKMKAMTINSFSELKLRLKQEKPVRVAVAAVEDRVLIEAVLTARREGIIEPILVGREASIKNLLASQLNKGEAVPRMVDIAEPGPACAEAIRLVREGEADLPMKGLVDTSIFLRAVLDREQGLRIGSLVSHVNVVQVETLNRLLLITDAAVNISPDVDQKIDILNNAIIVSRALGKADPNIALLCPVEKPNDRIESTQHAVEIKRRWEKGMALTGSLVSGPLALDNIISVEAAKIKGITDPVAGQANIILVHNLEVGNVLIKAIEYFARSIKAGVIIGAKVPLILTSRSSSVSNKLDSIRLGVLVFRTQY